MEGRGQKDGKAKRRGEGWEEDVEEERRIKTEEERERGKEDEGRSWWRNIE